MKPLERASKPNILFIMCDQLRQDYLSCYGHPTLHTPNIDRLAERGLRFSNAYCQAPLCGPSRTSFYSGRYQSSHGVMANQDATRLDEMMMADYLRPLGYRSAVVGKTHNHKDLLMMQNLGINPQSDFGRASQSGGFEPYEHHEGLYPDPIVPEFLPYNEYLQSQGYDGSNPWETWANSALSANGEILTGWRLRHSIHPARVAAEHSETAWTTTRAIDFIKQQAPSQPWCLHLSYIKPHWPLMAPAPYHQFYSSEDVLPVVRSASEKANPHPVIEAFMQLEHSQSYASDELRTQILPAYMGLVRQIDDELGRLFQTLETLDLSDNTVIVFTTDHGDYLGDHWLGEKDLFHEPSVKIPLIIANPQSSADQSRGTVCDRLVEAIDLLPTLLELCGGEVSRERLEGHSLIPMLTSSEAIDHWRAYAVSETDYSDRGVRDILQQAPYECRATMVRDERWKYIHYQGFRPQLFDLCNDPNELIDLGESKDHQQVRDEMRDKLIDWKQTRLKPRTGQDYKKLASMGPDADEAAGIIIGRW